MQTRRRQLLLLLASVFSQSSSALAPPAPASGTIGGLTLVKGASRGAACLDGSSPGYWIRTSTAEADQNRWVLHAQGGGWCYSEKGCAGRATGALGSSKAWTPSTRCYGKCDGILSPDAASNPDFHGWNAVWIGYCDGTSMTGARNSTHGGLYYRGRANLDAVLDSLLERGMANATDVIFTGGSAGGLAVYLNLDHVAKRVVAMSPKAKVVGLADAGFFLDHAAYGTQQHVYTDGIKYLFNMAAPQTNQACMDAHAEADSWKCMMAQYSAPFVSAPLFMAEGMYDSWQVSGILRLGCGIPTPEKTCTAEQLTAFFDYGQAMNATLYPLAKSSNRGCFLAACIVHCQSVFNQGPPQSSAHWDIWTIGGKTLREAFGNFYFNRAGPKQLVDALPYPSNPSCPIWPLSDSTHREEIMVV